MFAAAYTALFERSYSCSRHVDGSLVILWNDVIVLSRLVSTAGAAIVEVTGGHSQVE